MPRSQLLFALSLSSATGWAPAAAKLVPRAGAFSTSLRIRCSFSSLQGPDTFWRGFQPPAVQGVAEVDGRSVQPLEEVL